MVCAWTHLEHNRNHNQAEGTDTLVVDNTWVVGKPMPVDEMITAVEVATVDRGLIVDEVITVGMELVAGIGLAVDRVVIVDYTCMMVRVQLAFAAAAAAATSAVVAVAVVVVGRVDYGVGAEMMVTS